MLNIFLFNNFCEKSNFSEKLAKNWFLEDIWRFFREKRRFAQKIKITFLSQIRYGIFYYLAAFSKKAVFSEKMAKNRFRGPNLFWRKGGIWRRKWYYLFFMGNGVLNIFSSNNFFEKSNIFGENGGKKILGDMTIF